MVGVSELQAITAGAAGGDCLPALLGQVPVGWTVLAQQVSNTICGVRW
jgi:hypothetical protein